MVKSAGTTTNETHANTLTITDPDSHVPPSPGLLHVLYRLCLMESRARRDIYRFQEEAPHAALIIPSYRPPLDKLLINAITIIVMSVRSAPDVHLLLRQRRECCTPASGMQMNWRKREA